MVVPSLEISSPVSVDSSMTTALSLDLQNYHGHMIVAFASGRMVPTSSPSYGSHKLSVVTLHVHQSPSFLNLFTHLHNALQAFVCRPIDNKEVSLDNNRYAKYGSHKQPSIAHCSTEVQHHYLETFSAHLTKPDICAIVIMPNLSCKAKYSVHKLATDVKVSSCLAILAIFNNNELELEPGMQVI